MSRRAHELGALNLGQGFPDYDIDPRLTELVTEAMAAGHNQYAPMGGVPELSEQIARKLAATYGTQFDPVSQVTVTLGATEGLYSAIQAVVAPGDEVMCSIRRYDSYDPAVRLAGGRVHPHPAAAPGFSLRLGSHRRPRSPIARGSSSSTVPTIRRAPRRRRRISSSSPRRFAGATSSCCRTKSTSTSCTTDAHHVSVLDASRAAREAASRCFPSARRCMPPAFASATASRRRS